MTWKRYITNLPWAIG